MNGYRDRLVQALGTIDEGAIEWVVSILAEARSSGARLWIIGNGGSATTADHFATDLLRCTDASGTPIRAISLCSNQGIVTATANDYGYEHVFTRQLRMAASPEDILLSLSASGNSPNILAAIRWAKENSVLTIALTGFDGGAASTLADVSVHVESAVNDYGVVEDVHLAICHMISEHLRVE